MCQMMKRILLFILLATVIAGGATWWQFRSALDEAEARLATGSQIVATPCGTIEYVMVGSGRPLLAIHGAGGGYTQLMEFAGPLQTAGFQMIAMSRFGYLRTPMPADASPVAQAEAHACLMDALGVKSAAFIGISAGAPSAMQFCIRHQGRCSLLVLLVPAAYAEGRTTESSTPHSPFMQFVLERVLTSNFVMWVVTRVAPGILIETALATPIEVFEKAPSPEQARAMRLIRDIFPVGPKVAGIRNDTAISSELKRYPLEQIKAPTLVISVEDDLYGTFANAQYTAKHVPKARLVTYPSGGHVWLGHDAEIREEIVGFLIHWR